MINYKQLFLLAFFSVNYCLCLGQEKHLQEKWLVYKNGAYRPFSQKDNGKVSTVYFPIRVNNTGDSLYIKSNQGFALFINGKLATTVEKSETRLSIDSLSHKFHSADLFIGLHQQTVHTSNLLTAIINSGSQHFPTEEPLSKPSTYFMDFVLVGALIILGMLVLVIRLNSKLAADYFSVVRIFSLRESDDSQLHGRITSSSNILFYSYCSLIVSFYLMIIFHFVPSYFTSAWPFQAASFPMAIVQWLKLSFFLLSVFFIKIILIYLFTRIFALQDIFGLHVFNWIRLMLIFFGTLLIILMIYHITRGQNKEIYSIFMWASAWVLGIWVIVVFPKVMRRTNYSLFHIFSYICATEVIPLLISIKIIYY